MLGDENTYVAQSFFVDSNTIDLEEVMGTKQGTKGVRKRTTSEFEGIDD